MYVPLVFPQTIRISVSLAALVAINDVGIIGIFHRCRRRRRRFLQSLPNSVSSVSVSSPMVAPQINVILKSLGAEMTLDRLDAVNLLVVGERQFVAEDFRTFFALRRFLVLPYRGRSHPRVVLTLIKFSLAMVIPYVPR